MRSAARGDFGASERRCGAREDGPHGRDITLFAGGPRRLGCVKVCFEYFVQMDVFAFSFAGVSHNDIPIHFAILV